MISTAEAISGFVGGQLEIDNSQAEYHFRGPIKSAILIDDRLTITFEWCGEKVGDGWVKCGDLTYEIMRDEIDQSLAEAGNHSSLIVMTGKRSDCLTFYPPDAPSNLRPEDVKGL